MSKTEEAVKYMIDLFDEVTGKTWRKTPDHVQQKFLKAESELLTLADVSNNEMALFCGVKKGYCPYELKDRRCTLKQTCLNQVAKL